MKKTNILFEGHDLKFLTHVINHFSAKNDFLVEVLTYPGHEISDTGSILKVLPRFDIIFCEWGLGNLRWFSNNKLPGQKLITRIHSQEFSTSYLSETHWENVDKIILVGPFMMEKFIKLFPNLREKCIVISNLIDTSSFKLNKEKNTIYNLGLLGILPKQKSPHLGLEILKELRKTDERYRLFIKGKRPEEVDWLWKKSAEQDYYTEFYHSISKMGLKKSVIFDPHGGDVPQWFQKIGFVLSTSEYESFHMAIAEGMASGSVPIIRNWDGAEDLFPKKYFFNTIHDAVLLIQQYSNRVKFESESKYAKKYCQQRFSLQNLLPAYDEILIHEIDGFTVRDAFQKQVEISEKLTAGLLNLKKEKEIIQGEQKNEVDQLNRELALHLDTENKLKEDLNKLGTELSLIRDELKGLKNEKVLLQEELLGKKNENINLLKELTGLKNENMTLLKELTGLKNENANLMKELNGLKNENANLMKELNGLKNENANLMKELNGLKNENANLLKEMTGLKNENATLREELAGLKNEKTTLQEKLSVLNIENVSLREAVINHIKENSVLTQTLKDKITENNLIVKQYQREQNDHVALIGLLEAELLETKRRLMEVYDSITWKFGSALIRKPMNFFSNIKRKLSSEK